MKRTAVLLMSGIAGAALLAVVAGVLLGIQMLTSTLGAMVGSLRQPEPQRTAEEAVPLQKPKSLPRSRAKDLLPESVKPRYDCAKVRCVALTFDDGPGPYTAQLLKTLAEHRAPATFFVVGKMVREHPQTLRDALAGGHEIGNHTWDHADLTRATPGEVRSQLLRTQELIRSTTGVAPRLVRPPYGSSNKKVTKATRAMRTAQILWSVDPQDWSLHDRRRVAKKVLRTVQPGQIVLMHDINKATVNAVPQIIAALERKQYRFVTVSELLAGTPVEAGGLYRQRPDPADPVADAPSAPMPPSTFTTGSAGAGSAPWRR